MHDRWLLSFTRASTLTLALVALWCVTHQYRGIAFDGELYAFQALAKINATLKGDIYLAFRSQDQFTIFSSIYAFFISKLGLQSAELLIFLACLVTYLISAYSIARTLFRRSGAWLAVAALIIVPGRYGAYDVFSYSEDYLTARSLAVALIVASLALFYRKRSCLCAFTAAIALLVHPIMALPGLLLLFCLVVPIDIAAMCAAISIFCILGVAALAACMPTVVPALPLMDSAWLEVVRERSQFLFLSTWRSADWELVARPFVALTLASMTTADVRIRKLCSSVMIIGICGLLVAWIAEGVGPVAALIQGQAWRWMWVTGFASIVLLAPTVLAIGRDPKCGLLCSVLLIGGSTWNSPGTDNLLLTELALVLWLLRDGVNDRVARWLKWTAAAATLLLTAWLAANTWNDASSPSVNLNHESLLLLRLRRFFNMGISAAAIAFATDFCIARTRSAREIAFASVALMTALVWLVPYSFKQSNVAGTDKQIAEFTDWRSRIPADQSVLIVPPPTTAAFPWLTLQRRSYMSIDQSSGVVFSRETAMEIRRRSQVLLPVADPDWRILSRLRSKTLATLPPENLARPLTEKSLVSICTDPQLGFVIAKEVLRLAALRHIQKGPWENWNLYDCQHLGAPAPKT